MRGGGCGSGGVGGGGGGSGGVGVSCGAGRAGGACRDGNVGCGAVRAIYRGGAQCTACHPSKRRIRRRRYSAPTLPQQCPDLASTVLRPCLNTEKLPQQCPDLASTVPNTCLNTEKLPQHCPDLASTVPNTCLNTSAAASTPQSCYPHTTPQACKTLGFLGSCSPPTFSTAPTVQQGVMAAAAPLVDLKLAPEASRVAAAHCPTGCAALRAAT